MLAWDTFYNLPQVQLRSLAVLQTLHINSKLRQQQWQTHYIGKKERVFKKSLPSFHFCLRKHCRAAHAVFPLPHQGCIQPFRSVLHTKAKGRWGQCLGCKIARRERSVNGIFSQLGRKNSQTWSTSCRDVCFWPRQTEGTRSPPRTALENTTATKAVGKALLLASPAVVTMLRNTTQLYSPISALLWSPCNPLPLNDKGVQSFPSCCVSLRCMGAAPFLLHSSVYLALMHLAPWYPSHCNSR